MKIFEQISFIYIERDRSEGLNNLFVLSLVNQVFHTQKTKLEKLYLREKVQENATSDRWHRKFYK
jgi:hypothetical protein